MVIHICKFIYNHFNQLKNIEYELDWIIGYSNRKNMQAINYNQLILFEKETMEFELPFTAYASVSKEIGSDRKEDIEKAVNILYLALYVIGGTN